MATSPEHSFVADRRDFITLRTNLNTVVKSGDLIWWDASVDEAKVTALDADVAFLAGASEDTNPIVSLNEKQSKIRVRRVGTVRLKSTATETYKNGTAVYLGADAQTVTTVAGTNKVGYVEIADGSTVSITGAAGVLIPVRLEVKWPSVNLAS